MEIEAKVKTTYHLMRMMNKLNSNGGKLIQKVEIGKVKPVTI